MSPALVRVGVVARAVLAVETAVPLAVAQHVFRRRDG